jgi:hypothetical protein
MPGRIRFLRRSLGVMILTLSTGIFLWGVWPLPQASQSVLIPQARRLVLAWPATVRLGDAQSVRMQLEPDLDSEPGTAAAAPLAGDVNSNVMAAARLEFAGLLFYPADMVSQPLRPGKPVAFRWQFRPDGKGVYNGVAWLYYLDVPLNGDAETLTPVSAKEIQIRTIALFGLSGLAARLLGGVGILAGGLLGLDGALVWLQHRMRRRGGLHQTTGFNEQ